MQYFSEQGLDPHSGGRYIGSLAGLLRDFGVKFTIEPPAEYLCMASAYRRKDRPVCPDADVVYYVTSWDERARWPEKYDGTRSGGGLLGLIHDLEHAASCACTGCYSRTWSNYQSYQKKLAAET